MPNPMQPSRPAPKTLQEALAEIDALNRRVERERRARKEAENIAENAMRVAVEDPLTKLANRIMVNDQLRLEIDIAKRRGGTVLVLYMDLDNFKTVNDTYGHETGDALLCHAAKVLKNAMRPEDVVGRLGGDEFVVVSNGVSKEKADWFIQRLQQTLKESPLILNGITLPLRASIGAAAVDGFTSADDALHRADSAMYQAKKSSFTNCRLFDQKLAKADQTRRDILRALPHAVKKNQIVVHYQPIVDIRSGYIKQLEALVRWQREDELLQLESFLSIAEESGYINEIGQHVIERCLVDIKNWHKRGCIGSSRPPKVALNISPKQLLDPGFAYKLKQRLLLAELETNSIILEVTEFALLVRDDTTVNNLKELSEAGFLLSLGNFGTGHISLTMLRSLPFSYVKIDGTLVDNSTCNEQNLAVVKAINTVAHTLSAKTIVEEIECQGQLEIAHSSGCDYVQGFLFLKAVSADQIEALFDTHFNVPNETSELQNEQGTAKVIPIPLAKKQS